MLQESDANVVEHPAYRRYHYGAEPLLVVDGARARFIGTDALGSPTDLTGPTGQVEAKRQYDAWGRYRNGTAPAPGEAKLGFTGHQFDPETGLIYARARYYDPEIGRFISRDTYEGEIEEAPSLHRFAYVRANPLRFTDPSGHCAVNRDGTINCLAPAMAMQRQLTARMSSAWAEGSYGTAAWSLLLATANTVSVAAGAAAQLTVGMPYNAGYDASAGFRTGDYDRARRGSTELLLIAGGEKLMKAAWWVEETAVPAVKTAFTQVRESLNTKLAPEVAGAERAAITEAVEQATQPGTAQTAAVEVGTPTPSAAASEEEAAAGYIYRGVHAEHPALPEAQRGRVVPGNPEGTVTPEQHNTGGSGADSPYTSWTHEPRVAVEHATKRGPGGVVLRVPVGAPPEGATWRWEWSPDAYHESEVLLKGVREGAKILRPEEVPTLVGSGTGT